VAWLLGDKKGHLPLRAVKGEKAEVTEILFLIY
jgi:hypothetical protein